MNAARESLDTGRSLGVGAIRSGDASRPALNPDGHIFKLIGDAGPGGSNSPGFGDNGFVETNPCRRSIRANPN
jgi:hypothetical protein